MIGSWIWLFGRESLRRLSLLSAHRRRTETGSRVRSTAHRRLALDAGSILCYPSPWRWKKAFHRNAQPAPEWSCLWGLGGSAPQQATWDLRASENPRFGLGGSHEALLAGFSYPVFMPFREVFLQMRKEDAYTSSFSSSASFNLMAPSMTPSTMGRYFSGQSCNLWLVRWRCSLSSRSSSGLK